MKITNTYNTSFNGRGKISIKTFNFGVDSTVNKIRLIIEDGDEFIDESKLPEADSIVQKGGVIDGVLKAAKVFYFKGKFGGIEAKKAYILGNADSLNIKGDIHVQNASIKALVGERIDTEINERNLPPSRIIDGNLTLSGNSSIAKDSIVKVTGNTTFKDNATNHGTLYVKRNLIGANNTGTFEQGSNTTVDGDAVYDTFVNRGNVTINGSMRTNSFTSGAPGATTKSFTSINGNLTPLEININASIFNKSQVEIKGDATFSTLNNFGILDANNLIIEPVGIGNWSKLKNGSTTRAKNMVTIKGNTILEPTAKLHAKNLNVTPEINNKVNFQEGAITDVRGNANLSGKFENNGKFGVTGDLTMSDSVKFGAKSSAIVEGNVTLHDESSNFGELTITKSLNLAGNEITDNGPSLESGIITVKTGDVKLKGHAINKTLLIIKNGNLNMADYSTLSPLSKTDVVKGSAYMNNHAENQGILNIKNDLTMTEFSKLSSGSTTNVQGSTYKSANVEIEGVLNCPSIYDTNKAK